MLRVIIPDSHGCYIDRAAADAFLSDLKELNPESIIMLGDHIDVGGLFNAHPNNYLKDMEYSYEDDCAAANDFLDAIQARAPRAVIEYLEGNHEQHVERWIARTYKSQKDATIALEDMAPWLKLRLKKRGIRYHRCSEFHDGLSMRGIIKRGKCFFTHGFKVSKFATAAHLDAVGGNVVHGHTHRSQSHVKRTVENGEIGGWCPGTLAVFQPLYMHSNPSDHTHGYAIQAVDKDGSFMHIQVPIIRGRSKMKLLLR
jgi:predicted phosphodiesterase